MECYPASQVLNRETANWYLSFPSTTGVCEYIICIAPSYRVYDTALIQLGLGDREVAEDSVFKWRALQHTFSARRHHAAAVRESEMVTGRSKRPNCEVIDNNCMTEDLV